MADPEPDGGRWFVAGLAGLAGPAAAVLYDRGALTWAPSNLAPVAAVALVAGIGLAIGVWASRRRPRWIGFGAVATNGVVLFVYGFLWAFFGLGGSR